MAHFSKPYIRAIPWREQLPLVTLQFQEKVRGKVGLLLSKQVPSGMTLIHCEDELLLD